MIKIDEIGKLPLPRILSAAGEPLDTITLASDYYGVYKAQWAEAEGVYRVGQGNHLVATGYVVKLIELQEVHDENP